MILKNLKSENTNISGTCVSLGGVRMEDGRTWGLSEDLISRNILVTENNVELGPVSILKSVQITASHKNKTCHGSVTPKLINSAYVDMKASSSEEMELIIYGGQKVDLIRSSN